MAKRLDTNLLKEGLREINPILRGAILEEGLDIPKKVIGADYTGYLTPGDIGKLDNSRQKYIEVKERLLRLSLKHGILPEEYEKANKYVVDALGI